MTELTEREELQYEAARLRVLAQAFGHLKAAKPVPAPPNSVKPDPAPLPVTPSPASKQPRYSSTARPTLLANIMKLRALRLNNNAIANRLKISRSFMCKILHEAGVKGYACQVCGAEMGKSITCKECESAGRTKEQ